MRNSLRWGSTGPLSLDAGCNAAGEEGEPCGRGGGSVRWARGGAGGDVGSCGSLAAGAAAGPLTPVGPCGGRG